MTDLREKYDAFLSEFGEGRKMVLSTSENDRVTSRMMSVVRIGDKYWFQTDKMMRKYHQLLANRYAALCIDNIQIEGICEEKGRPSENAAFCEAFRKCFSGSYNAYTSLKNERLFVLTPLRIERWIYRDGAPYIEIIDPEQGRYSFEPYTGI